MHLAFHCPSCPYHPLSGERKRCLCFVEFAEEPQAQQARPPHSQHAHAAWGSHSGSILQAECCWSLQAMQILNGYLLDDELGPASARLTITFAKTQGGGGSGGL